MSGLDLGYVVVEGPIGVGKTTLARRLARSCGANLLLEAPQDNPYLPRFYQDPAAYALPTQLHFLLQRARQLATLRQRDLFAGMQVADYMVDKDRLFAELTLEVDELALYRELHERIMGPLPAPDLVIYLQAPVPVLLERIARRGVDYEAPLGEEYLHRLVEAYTRFFYHFESSPLVIVNAAEVDLAHNEEDYRLLFEQLRTIRKGRHYLNPLPF